MSLTAYGLEFDPDAYATSYKYIGLADYFEILTKSGALKRNDALPAEQRLSAQSGASPGTARRAVQELRERGLVLTVRCKGTFVTYDPSEQVTL